MRLFLVTGINKALVTVFHMSWHQDFGTKLARKQTLEFQSLLKKHHKGRKLFLSSSLCNGLSYKTFQPLFTFNGLP